MAFKETSACVLVHVTDVAFLNLLDLVLVWSGVRFCVIN